jgi:hypothetical protein
VGLGSGLSVRSEGLGVSHVIAHVVLGQCDSPDLCHSLRFEE